MISKILAEHGVISGVSVLIGSKEKPFGILGAFSRSRRLFNLDEIHFLQAVANILAATVELHTSEEKYRRLFDLESDALLLIEKESGRILEANSAAVALYGYERAELLRMCNTDLSAEPELTHQSVQREETNIPVRLAPKKGWERFPGGSDCHPFCLVWADCAIGGDPRDYQPFTWLKSRSWRRAISICKFYGMPRR